MESVSPRLLSPFVLSKPNMAIGTSGFLWVAKKNAQWQNHSLGLE